MKKRHLKLIIAIFLVCNNPVTIFSLISQEHNSNDSSDSTISFFYLLIAFYSLFISRKSLKG